MRSAERRARREARRARRQFRRGTRRLPRPIFTKGDWQQLDEAISGNYIQTLQDVESATSRPRRLKRRLARARDLEWPGRASRAMGTTISWESVPHTSKGANAMIDARLTHDGAQIQAQHLVPFAKAAQVAQEFAQKLQPLYGVDKVIWATDSDDGGAIEVNIKTESRAMAKQALRSLLPLIDVWDGAGVDWGGPG